MPKRTDLKSILIIGAGPIIIGQACEFDYSGVQACKALREEGYKVILINSNPATIMTDPATADVTYIEPITWQTVEKIIAKERPDAILPTMGGQTALNCALDLWRQGVLDKYQVELIGATPEAIDKAEDRLKFKDAMTKIGLGSARSGIAHSMAQAWEVQKMVGFPTVIRPSFTLGGTGGGIAYNAEEFEAICKRGLEASPTNELLIEESLLGWKEYEMEVVRDKKDNCIIVCSIENLDPMGVHTGDSITVAPAQTLTDKEYQIMRNASLAVLREIGVDTGGSNVQFSINPKDGRMIVIEMNPRVSRSSALASKATGFPIAKVAAKLAVGYTLDELKNEITGGATPASFEPSIDYVVTNANEVGGRGHGHGAHFSGVLPKSPARPGGGRRRHERENPGPRGAGKRTRRTGPRPHLVRGRRLRAGHECRAGACAHEDRPLVFGADRADRQDRT
jgi:carbamoyl-phosphate synthase large subunit